MIKIYKLDFNLRSAEERVELVRKINLEECSSKDLSLIADYICCGEDKDGKSPVQKKNIEIDSHYKTYQQKSPLSLEEMLENPNFDESILFPLGSNRYVNKKRKSDEEKYKKIQGMEELNQSIEQLEKYLHNNSLDDKRRYQLNHFLIQLKQQRYVLIEEAYPTEFFYKEGKINRVQVNQFEEEGVEIEGFPSGMYSKEKKEFKQGTSQFYSLDFTDFYVIKKIILFRNELGDRSLIGDTIDYYIERANLNLQDRIVLYGKMNKYNLKKIQDMLNKRTGVFHRISYISFIWGRVIKKIIKVVYLVRDEIENKDREYKWQTCGECKKKLLKDRRNFNRKNKEKEEYMNICKECLRKRRDKRNGKKINDVSFEF